MAGCFFGAKKRLAVEDYPNGQFLRAPLGASLSGDVERFGRVVIPPSAAGKRTRHSAAPEADGRLTRRSRLWRPVSGPREPASLLFSFRFGGRGDLHARTLSLWQPSQRSDSIFRS